MRNLELPLLLLLLAASVRGGVVNDDDDDDDDDGAPDYYEDYRAMMYEEYGVGGEEPAIKGVQVCEHTNIHLKNSAIFLLQSCPLFSAFFDGCFGNVLI